MRTKLIRAVAMPLFALLSTAKAAAAEEEFYDADEVVSACEAVEFVSNNNRRSIATTDRSAAIVSWRQSSSNSGIYTSFTVLLPPGELELPQPADSLAIEINACWAVRRVGSRSQLPTPLPDAQQAFRLTCKPAPRRLKEKLPQLFGDAIHIYPQQQRVALFGLTLPLAPHAGRRYTAVNNQIAVTVDKEGTNYTTTLPNGWKFTGECSPQS